MIGEKQSVRVSLQPGTVTVDRLCRMILERDRLIYHESEDAWVEYMLKIGSKEHLVWKKRIELEKARRRVDLICRYIDDGLTPNMESIDSVIRTEFEQRNFDLWMLGEDNRELMSILSSDRLSDEEYDELCSLYLSSLIKLHDVTEDREQKCLFFQKLFVKKNLDALRTAYASIPDGQQYDSSAEDKL